MRFSITAALETAWGELNVLLAESNDGMANRELALAKTAVEEAQMRYTRALAIIHGTFDPFNAGYQLESKSEPS